MWSNERMGSVFGGEPFVREDLRGELEEMLQEYVDAESISQRWAEIRELLGEWMETGPEEVAERVLGPLSQELAMWETAVARPAAPGWLELVDADVPGAKQLVELTNAPGGYVLALMRVESRVGCHEEEVLEVAVLIDARRCPDTLERVPVSGAALLEQQRELHGELSDEQLLDGWSLRVYSCRWGVVEPDFVEIDAQTARSWIEGQPVALYKPGESLRAGLEELSVPQGSRALSEFWPSHQADAPWPERLKMEGEIGELVMGWAVPERPPAPVVQVAPRPPPPVRFSQRTLAEQWGELRSLLSVIPRYPEEGLEQWYTLQSMLEDWAQPEALGEEVVPYVSSRLQGWPRSLIRSASAMWLELYDKGDPLGAELMTLTNAPGGYLLKQGLYLAGYDHPGNGAIWLGSLEGVISMCESFIEEVAWSRGAHSALECEFSLWCCRWGYILGPIHKLGFEHDPIDDTLPEPEAHHRSGLPAIRFAPLPEDLSDEPIEATIDFAELKSTHTSRYGGGHACIEFAGDIDEVLLD